MARCAVFALGGTIAMAGQGGGAVPALSATDLIAALPGLDVDVEVVDFRRLPGASVDFADIFALLEAIAESDADGFVVTQGTDTIEETSYLLDLYYTGSRPIIVTGAMRNASLAGADGPANLLAAIRTAVSESAADLGVMVVFADEIHAARRVRKTHSTSVSTFQSPGFGPLGHIPEGVPYFHHRCVTRFTVAPPVRAPHVAVAAISFGDRGELLDGIESKVDGLVIAAMGAGHVPSWLVSTLDSLAAQLPVVLASRTAAGSILHSTYGFPGSESDLIARGLIPSGFLDAYKSRILLWALLAANASRAEIASAFSR